uniref:Uncharacterized protein n=1 Tax=Anguilla anguilla TaxID=7936 RepID=A0A0E9WMA7_ANGAN
MVFILFGEELYLTYKNVQMFPNSHPPFFRTVHHQCSTFVATAPKINETFFKMAVNFWHIRDKKSLKQHKTMKCAPLYAYKAFL